MRTAAKFALYVAAVPRGRSAVVGSVGAVFATGSLGAGAMRFAAPPPGPPGDERLRVLFVAPALGLGGMQRHAVTLLPALDPAKFDVWVVCLEGRGSLFGELLVAGVRARAFDGHGSKVRMSRAFLGLALEVRRVRPHVIMTAGYNADVFGRVVARCFDVPATVSWRHNCGDVVYGRRNRLTERVLGRFTTRYFAVAFGQIPYLVDDQRLAPDKIRVIHNSVEAVPGLDERQRLALRHSVGLRGSDQVIGMVALFRPEKDHVTMLLAFRDVSQRVPRARLMLVGDGPEHRRARALAAALGIDDRVLFLGERFDARDLVQLVEVAALCSTVECFPYAALEAMAAAKPVVSSAVGGMPELVEDGLTGYLVPPRDPRSLAVRMVTLLRDAGLARQMGQAGRRRLEDRFPFEGMRARVEAELVDAVASGRRRRSYR